MRLTDVLILFLDTQINMGKYLQRFSSDVSINWHYFHQDTGKTYSEILKLGSYQKYQKQASPGI